MATPQQLNVKLDAQTPYVFDLLIAEDDPNETPIDVSSWTFNFKLINSANVTIWDIVNADFSRPSTGNITFTKTQSQVAALVSGIYTIQLLVTKTGVVDDVYLTGYYER
jgi:hypothetical protein